MVASAKKNGKKMGRPVKTFSRAVFIALCKIQATLPEIAGAFECDEDTVSAWCKRTFDQTFSVVSDRYKGQGNISLRRKQNQVALSGNVKMLIWLGKNRLNQKDRSDVTTGDIPFPTAVTVTIVEGAAPASEP